MRLCSRCRQRAKGAEVRLSHQTEARWYCWPCIGQMSDRRGNLPPYGQCCFERPDYNGESVCCSCPVYRGTSCTSGFSNGTTHGESHTESNAGGESVTGGGAFTQTRTVTRSISSTCHSIEEQLHDTEQAIRRLPDRVVLIRMRDDTNTKPPASFTDGDGI